MLFPDQEKLAARAWVVGERIDLRGRQAGFDVLAASPLSVRLGPLVAVIFRYGAVVAFGGDPAWSERLLDLLRPHVREPLRTPARDAAEIRVAPGAREPVDPDGTLVLPDTSLEALQTVAQVLARSAVLAQYEAEVGAALERVEGPVETLRQTGRSRMGSRVILRQLGRVLASEMRSVGRAEVAEKPELLWERPDLDRLYVRLAEEYELEERDAALTRKLELLVRVQTTFLELLQTRRSLHVEWYIVALIVVEIVILVFDMFFRH